MKISVLWMVGATMLPATLIGSTVRASPAAERRPSTHTILLAAQPRAAGDQSTDADTGKPKVTVIPIPPRDPTNAHSGDTFHPMRTPVITGPDKPPAHDSPPIVITGHRTPGVHSVIYSQKRRHVPTKHRVVKRRRHG